MNLINNLIDQHCPNGVIFKELGVVCKIKTGQGINKIFISENPGKYPVINSGRAPLGFIDDWNTENDPIGITSRGAGVGSITWREGKYYRGNLNYSCTILDKKKLLIDYLYHLLNNMQTEIKSLCTFDGIPALNKTNLDKLKIPIPPLKIQKEVVDILNKFNKIEAELEAELEAEKEARLKQYIYYQNVLLNPEDETNIKWVTLNDIAELERGNGMPKTDFVESGIGCIHYGQLYTHYGIWATETISFVSPEKAKKLVKVDPGDIIITNTSEDIDGVCTSVAWLGDSQIVTGGHATVIKTEQNPKFLSYYFRTPYFYTEKIKYAFGAKVTDVSAKNLAKILIAIPPLEEQERIVSILDKFDALVNNISTGLPAEIKARRQQYEHYRNILLTFQESK